MTHNPDYISVFQKHVCDIATSQPSLQFQSLAKWLSENQPQSSIPIAVLSNLVRACSEPALEDALTTRLIAFAHWESMVTQLLCNATPTTAVIRVLIDVLSQRHPRHVLARIASFGAVCTVFDAMAKDSLLTCVVSSQENVLAGALVVAINHEDPLHSWLIGTVAEKTQRGISIKPRDVHQMPLKQFTALPLILLSDVKLKTRI